MTSEDAAVWLVAASFMAVHDAAGHLAKLLPGALLTVADLAPRPGLHSCLRAAVVAVFIVAIVVAALAVVAAEVVEVTAVAVVAIVVVVVARAAAEWCPEK